MIASLASLKEIIAGFKYIPSGRRDFILKELSLVKNDEIEENLAEKIVVLLEEELQRTNDAIQKDSAKLAENKKDIEKIENQLAPLIQEDARKALIEMENEEENYKKTLNSIQKNYEQKLEKEIKTKSDEKDADAIRQKLGLK